MTEPAWSDADSNWGRVRAVVVSESARVWMRERDRILAEAAMRPESLSREARAAMTFTAITPAPTAADKADPQWGDESPTLTKRAVTEFRGRFAAVSNAPTPKEFGRAAVPFLAEVAVVPVGVGVVTNGLIDAARVLGAGLDHQVVIAAHSVDGAAFGSLVAGLVGVGIARDIAYFRQQPFVPILGEGIRRVHNIGIKSTLAATVVVSAVDISDAVGVMHAPAAVSVADGIGAAIATATLSAVVAKKVFTAVTGRRPSQGIAE